MKHKIKNFFKTFMSIVIVMIGVSLMNFYVKSEFGIVSFILGMFGFIILYPAVKKWETILFSENAK